MLDAVGRFKPIVNNRRKRRAEISRFRRAGMLVTWLMDANDPSLHEVPPLLLRAAQMWCEDLPAAPRHCICCLLLIWERREVGALLLSKPPNAIGAGRRPQRPLRTAVVLDKTTTTKK